LDKLEFCVGYALSATPFKQKCNFDLLYVLRASAIIAHLCAPVPKYGVAKNNDEFIPSDADLTLTFAGLAGTLDPGFIQTLLMFFTLCCQLGVKKITDEFCISSQFAALFLRVPAVIGMSLVGGDFQLSSAHPSVTGSVAPFGQ
jgi:hypothetical protein